MEVTEGEGGRVSAGGGGSDAMLCLLGGELRQFFDLVPAAEAAENTGPLRCQHDAPSAEFDSEYYAPTSATQTVRVHINPVHFNYEWRNREI